MDCPTRFGRPCNARRAPGRSMKSKFRKRRRFTSLRSPSENANIGSKSPRMAPSSARSTLATTTGTNGTVVIRADEFQTVTPRVFSWQAYDPQVKCDLSSVALLTEEGLVLVDPIPLRDEALNQLTEG